MPGTNGEAKAVAWGAVPTSVSQKTSQKGHTQTQGLQQSFNATVQSFSTLSSLKLNLPSRQNPPRVDISLLDDDHHVKARRRASSCRLSS